MGLDTGVKGPYVHLGTLTYRRGALRPVVNGVLRTHNWVVNLRTKAMPSKTTQGRGVSKEQSRLGCDMLEVR